MRNLAIWTLLVGLCWSCDSDDDTADVVPIRENGTITPTAVVEGLGIPWGMAFLDEDTWLITERGGSLKLYNEGNVSEIIHGLPVRASGQGGLLDIRAGQEGWVYMTYSKDVGGGQSTTAVVRFKLSNNALTDMEELFEAVPYETGTAHYGSRIAFDDDGFMYITLGDRYRYSGGTASAITDPFSAHSQDLQSHWGKIIRLNLDGSVPADNPFADREDALPEIFSYGHRNPQGIAYDPVLDQVFANEHGARGGDEVNLIQAGRNYGWPVITYGIDYNREPIGMGTSMDGMVQPLEYWDPSIAPSSIAIYRGSKYPEWDGQWFFGTLANQTLFRLSWDGKTVTQEATMYREQFGRIRNVVIGPDELIYLLVDDGRVIRLDTDL